MKLMSWLACLTFVACAHSPLPGAALTRVSRPAFIARIVEKAGPYSTVFRDDDSYKAALKRLSPDEADRRLAEKLTHGVRDPKTGQRVIPTITRFEIADALRTETMAKLPRGAPWNATLSPVEVAGALESYLVDEVPANAPDYGLLKSHGADAVVEFVIEEYGMRSEDGRAGIALKGYARLFFIDADEVYVRRFFSDEVRAELPHLDPFAVAKNPVLFRDRMRAMVSVIAEQLAADLTPDDAPTASPAKPARDAAPTVPAEEDPL
ncbi:MAG: hypothetical protein JNG84_03200 [Archangium sp.]|nr:hypothetical protein [Archangium sp.]